MEGLRQTSAITNFTVPYEYSSVVYQLCSRYPDDYPNLDSRRNVSRISATLVSRFLLHLQSASLRAVGYTASWQASSTALDHSLVFERVVGSLGASISFDHNPESHHDGDMDDDGLNSDGVNGSTGTLRG